MLGGGLASPDRRRGACWLTCLRSPPVKGLSLIATNPKYFNQGAAKALILPMLEIADSEGRRTYLEATPTGRPLYEKWGFRVVDVLEFNLDELTADQHGLYKISIMIREPTRTK